MQVSRLLPWTIKNYKLDEIVTLGDLRRNVSLLFRQHANVTDPKVASLQLSCTQPLYRGEKSYTESRLGKHCK